MVGRFRIKFIAAFLFACLAVMALPAQNREYVVQKGDTLYSIARNHGLILQELLDANHLTKNSTLKAGQKLILPVKAKSPGKSPAPSAGPAPSPSPVPGANPEEPSAVTLEKYTVQKGDTLFGIARQNGVEVAVLLKANKIDAKSALKVGQVIMVPRPVVANVRAKPGASPVPTPSSSENPAVSANPSPTTSQSVDIEANTAQASEGTMLKTKPYTLGAKLSWPHPGERLQVDGKLPGLLIKAANGDSVKSISSGKVIYSSPHSTLGYMVFVLSNSGFTYIYGGNDSSALRVGDAVKVGDIIGQVGLTPGFMDPEVYFSTWKDGAYIDPSLVPRD